MAKIVCPVCTRKNKGNPAPERCDICGASLPSGGEQILRKDFASLRQNGKAVANGHAILTNQRLIFLEDKNDATVIAMFGLIGAAIASAFDSGKRKMLFQINRGELQHLEEGEVGKLKKSPTVVLQTNVGEYTLAVTKKLLPELMEAYAVHLN